MREGRITWTAAPLALLKLKLARFFGVGVLNTAFGYALYAVLVLCHLQYLAALLLSTIGGVIFNYFSMGRLVFRHAGGRLIFAKFVAVYAIVYAVNAILLRTLVGEFGLGPIVSQLLCMVPSILTSWLLMNYWVFKND